MLDGTSSVLYGTVPELTAAGRAGRAGRAFAPFDTGTIGAGAVSPLPFGALGDGAGPVVATPATAVTALTILPLALAVGGRLAGPQERGPGHGLTASTRSG